MRVVEITPEQLTELVTPEELAELVAISLEAREEAERRRRWAEGAEGCPHGDPLHNDCSDGCPSCWSAEAP